MVAHKIGVCKVRWKNSILRGKKDDDQKKVDDKRESESISNLHKEIWQGWLFFPQHLSPVTSQLKDCSITAAQNHNKKLHNQKLERKYNENFWNLQINNFHVIQNYQLMSNKEILFTVPDIQTPLQSFTEKKY